MTSHDLAGMLLSLPNVEVCDFDGKPIVNAISTFDEDGRTPIVVIETEGDV